MNKVEKIKKLADAMYDRMQNLTTDTSGIRKAMDEYHQFIINEYYKEDTEKDFGIKSNDLEEAACEYDNSHIDDNNFAFKAGAKWQKEKMMEDAVDGEIYFSLDYQQYRIYTEPLAYFHHGDKVKLIIIKEE